MEKIDGNQKHITLNSKEYIITTKYKDLKYGEILKAITAKLKDFERIYFIKNDDEYIKVEDQKILEYIKKNYENIETDVIY